MVMKQMKSFKNFLVLFYKSIKKDVEVSMKCSEFVFDGIDLLCYKCHKISLNRGASFMDSAKWLNKKQKITNKKQNKNNDKKYFIYSVIVALNHWKEIIFQSHEMIGKILNQIIKQLLRMCYTYRTIVKNKACMYFKA